MTTSTVSTLSEIPESLYYAIQSFLTSHPTWDSDRLVSESIALFLANKEQMEQET